MTKEEQKQRRREYMRKWREENPGYNKWACKKFRMMHKEYQAEWRKSNPEYNKIACKSYYERHKEKVRALQKEYYKAHREEIIEKQRQRKLKEKQDEQFEALS